MKYTHFSFDWGYAESSRFALLLMKHKEGFEDPHIAIKDLDNLLKEAIAYELGYTDSGRIELDEDSKACCKKYILDLSMNLCPVCGTKFNTTKKEDISTEDAWYNLCCGDNDSLGYNIWEFIEASKWSITYPETANWVLVQYANRIPDDDFGYELQY